VRPRPTLRIAKRRAPRASGEVSARQDGAGACTACHRGQLGDDRRPLVPEPRGRFKLTPQSCKLAVEAVEHRLPCRSHKNQCCHSRACLRRRPPGSLGAFGTKLGSNIAYLSDVDSSEHTPAPGPVPDRQIRGFLFAFPHPAACPGFDQYAPKTSRKARPAPTGSHLYPSGGLGEDAWWVAAGAAEVAALVWLHFADRGFICLVSLTLAALMHMLCAPTTERFGVLLVGNPEQHPPRSILRRRD